MLQNGRIVERFRTLAVPKSITGSWSLSIFNRLENRPPACSLPMREHGEPKKVANFGKTKYDRISVKARRIYPLRITVNGRSIQRIEIDPHYEEKHAEMNDFLILRIVQSLDGLDFGPVDRKSAWEYFEEEREFSGRRYRLVWCLNPGRDILGVINCFRR